MLGEVRLHVPGEINVQNALAAIAVARALRVDVRADRARRSTRFAACAALRDRRRARRRDGRRRLRAPSDRHRANDRRGARLSRTSRSWSRFSRIATRARATSRADFAAALRSADARAPRAGLRRVGSADRRRERTLDRRAARRARNAGDATSRSVDELLDGGAARRSVPRRVVLMLGAGSISGVAHRLGASLDSDSGRRAMNADARRCSPTATATRSRERFAERVRFDAPLAPLTWWKIGGPADATIAARARPPNVAFVLRWCFKRKLPWFVLGAGSNLLVGDGGMRGLVLRLGGELRRARRARRRRRGRRARRRERVARRSSSRRRRRSARVGVDGLAGIPATRRRRAAHERRHRP